MTVTEFEKIIEAAGLVTMSSWSPRFVVALQIPSTYGLHSEIEAIEYLPIEFAVLTTERAMSQIEAVRKRLVKAATEKLRTGI